MGSEGVTLSVTSDPILLLYDGGDDTLPPALGKPLVTLESLPGAISLSGPTTLTVAINGTASYDVELIGPLFWMVNKVRSVPNPQGKSLARFTCTPPKDSAVREADFIIPISDIRGRRVGQLLFHCPISE